MKLPKRKPTRLKNYDYSEKGYYFITICTKNKAKFFGSIVGGDAPNIALSKIGETVNKYILSSNSIPEITVEKYVIMPNHIHLILMMDNKNGTSRAPNGTSKAPSPTNNIISHSGIILTQILQNGVRLVFIPNSFCIDIEIFGKCCIMNI